MTDPLVRLQLDWDGAESVRVTIRGEIDLSNADDLERELMTALAPADAVTIDLREVTYLDSQGVRLLHHLSTGTRARNERSPSWRPRGRSRAASSA